MKNELQMMKTWILLVIILAIKHSLISAQQCEDFNKSLFHILPDTFPDKINCIDSNGLKQGWWIDYKIKYNPVDRPDELAKGNYVDKYSFGKYKNNIKNGDWVSIANVHLIYETRRDNYLYSKDAIMITSRFAEGESTLYYNADSSIIKSTSLCPDEKFPICIDCCKNGSIGKECKMMYRNEKIKEFPYVQFDTEFYGSFIDYKREKRTIDNKLDK
jgi:hypothetical protein